MFRSKPEPEIPDVVKAGLWIVDWTMDWTVDWIMDWTMDWTVEMHRNDSEGVPRLYS